MRAMASQGMLPPLSYLAWAREHFAKARFDLATSGLRSVTVDEILSLSGERSPAPDDYGLERRFRDAIAGRYRIPEDHVVPSLGASGGIWLTLATALSRGHEVLVEDPTYEPLHAVAVGLGAIVRRFVRRQADGFALDVDAVLGGVRPQTRVVIVSNPHNPSAAFAGDDTMHELAEKLAARDVLLLVDEAYRELAAPRSTAHSLGGNVCAVSSTTKCFGMGWTRAGWALLPPSLVPHATHAVAHTCGHLPPSSFGFGALGLAHADELLARTSERQAGKVELVADFAARHVTDLGWMNPPGRVPFSFFIDRRGGDLLDLIERGVAAEGVLVAPGHFFGYPSGFRLSMTAPLDVLAQGLSRLPSVLGFS